eukprot:scaffold2720_cov173-Amphora_coffeaeformis.AAC.15
MRGQLLRANIFFIQNRNECVYAHILHKKAGLCRISCEYRTLQDSLATGRQTSACTLYGAISHSRFIKSTWMPGLSSIYHTRIGFRTDLIQLLDVRGNSSSAIFADQQRVASDAKLSHSAAAVDEIVTVSNEYHTISPLDCVREIKVNMKSTTFCLLMLLAQAASYDIPKPPTSRRVLLEKVFMGSAAVTAASFGLTPDAALASGGATAGKYTTIPIAKRRYYGRVQEAVHEFVLMGEDVVKADMSSSRIQNFFDPNGAVIVEAKRKDVNGQCTKKDNDCRGKEVRDSRYNDMKASMYLLGNAFRTDQQKPPDRLPTVKAAKAFFKEMDAMEKCVKKKKTNDKEAVGHYVAALDILDQYLDLVELPPIDGGYYDQAFDTRVGETARIM